MARQLCHSLSAYKYNSPRIAPACHLANMPKLDHLSSLPH
ncbi:hypothetical protein BURPS1106B_1824 [Burkholderia pseudomallei 1106b]|uniref:Uncharacterized protein n=2 Tax=Burkholderia pseudomallei TaxID=28450 RepID=A0A0E1VPR1_BURPE|nr:hypothetical protein BURPS1106A_A0166 [Burkholderia pseudomallei 1106a]EEC33845.1 conserved hypothetical protein [Burkholderia pseudomallei 576]EEH25209.1 conserved hypothetical protein [Burkholderia pseudomallei Pakistan 9]EES21850.1 hypothetical protein BURPS1106B_1824 [Burkholderia pseudomallei 1106b]EET02803.1 hypothetical protein BURPS1710A_A2657 [Burkholderia pseudomallei 1710a]